MEGNNAIEADDEDLTSFNNNAKPTPQVARGRPNNAKNQNDRFARFHQSDEHSDQSHQQQYDNDGIPVTELIVNRDLQPPFLQQQHSGTNLGAAAVSQQNSAQMDIIVPVTSPTAELVLAAEKGSEGLVLFRREMAAALASRQAMDTTQSDLAKILRRNEGQIEESVGDNNNNNKQNKRGRQQDGNADQSFEDESAAAKEEEVESLRRKIRILEDKAAAASAAVHAQRPQEPSTQRPKKDTSSIIDPNFVSLDDDAWAALQSSRRRLPIYQCKDELLRYIGENTVSIVMGETGSGKTTQLVQYLYEQGYARGDQLIGCTQPRRIAAVGVATRVAEEVGCPLGGTVGYAIHLDDRTSDSTRIRFMTDGVLLRELVHDRDVQKYSVIILDEAHERSVDTDVLLGVLKDVCRRRLDLKVIVTSATMDLVKFSRFFDNAPFYEISGVTYDVDVRYASVPVRDYVTEAVFKAISIHVQNPISAGADGGEEGGGDILIFMTGRDDVYGTCEMIEKTLKEKFAAYAHSLLVIPCMSEASGMQATVGSVLGPAPPGKRKCVVSTNVAETSLTIHGVRYVIDCGFMKANVFRPRVGMNTLRRYPTSQAQANQRKGRAGRTAEGICFRLYTKEQFQEQMLIASVPEIQRSSIDSVVLLLKSIGVEDLSQFDFIDPPPEANVRNALWRLWLLGALWDHGKISPLGLQMLEFPTSPHLAKLLVDASAMGCITEALHIVSMISSDPKGLFDLPKGKEEKAAAMHSRFYVHDSDHLTMHQVLLHYLQNGRSRHWAQEHFLNIGALERACAVLEQLEHRCKMCIKNTPKTKQTAAYSSFSSIQDHEGAENDAALKIRQCIAKAFVVRSARRHAGKWTEYVSLLNAGVVCHLHPSSALNAAGSVPEYIVYGDLLFTTKEYAMTVTAVEPEWLVEAGKGLFQVKGERLPEPEVALLPLPVVAVPSSSSVGGVVASRLQQQQQVRSSATTIVGGSIAKRPTSAFVGNKKRGNV